LLQTVHYNAAAVAQRPHAALAQVAVASSVAAIMTAIDETAYCVGNIVQINVMGWPLRWQAT